MNPILSEHCITLIFPSRLNLFLFLNLLAPLLEYVQCKKRSSYDGELGKFSLARLIYIYIYIHQIVTLKQGARQWKLECIYWWLKLGMFSVWTTKHKQQFSLLFIPFSTYDGWLILSGPDHLFIQASMLYMSTALLLGVGVNYFLIHVLGSNTLHSWRINTRFLYRVFEVCRVMTKNSYLKFAILCIMTSWTCFVY